MGKPQNYDFSGWATKYNIMCADGRSIAEDAFAHCDGCTVPLLYNHNHTDCKQVVGNAYLEWRNDGMYMYGSFNGSDEGVSAREAVMHGDISNLSIQANHLKHNGSTVTYGRINEVSLVIAGANPEAKIDFTMAHSDDPNEYESLEAWYNFGNLIVHADTEESSSPSNDDTDSLSAEDINAVYDTFTEEQKDALAAVIGMILTSDEGDSDDESDAVEHADGPTIKDIMSTLNAEQQKVAMVYIVMAAAEAESDDNNIEHSDEEDDEMKRNIFDNTDNVTDDALTHADLYNEAHALCMDGRFTSFKEAVKAVSANHAAHKDTLQHGIDPDDVSTLFEDPHLIGPNAPEKLTRDMTWAEHVLSRVNKVPYQRLKVRFNDIRQIELAKGYITGDEKEKINDTELIHRTVDPQTVYVTDTLDRDTILDVEGFDLVTYQYDTLQTTMKETLARAIMIGDGRQLSDRQKIKTTSIVPIWGDGGVFTIYAELDMAAARAALQGTNTAANFGDQYVYARALRNTILEAREQYKGSGSLEMFIEPRSKSTILEATDLNGRDMYETPEKLAGAFDVSAVHTVEQFSGLTRTTSDGKTMKLVAIIVNLRDYDLGNIKNGDLTRFEDFDIKHNEYTYLLEGRYCGMLVRPYSAIIVEEDVTVTG